MEILIFSNMYLKLAEKNNILLRRIDENPLVT